MKCLLPEERVRQRLISMMVGELGYPRGSLSVEVSLSSLPHLATHSGPLPNRRADLICFARGIHPEYDLFPLLLIECKAEKGTEAAWQQAKGYNLHVGAPFIAIATPDGVEVAHHSSDSRGSYLPSYETLSEQVALVK